MPLTPWKSDEKIDINSLFELSNYYLKKNIYEIISEFDTEKLKTLGGNSELLKNYIHYCKHCSYFQIVLLSFLFRGKKFYFPLLGRKPLSNSGIISFQSVNE